MKAQKAHYESMTNARLIEARDHSWGIEKMLGNGIGLRTTLRSARKRSYAIGQVVMDRMISGAMQFDSDGELISIGRKA